MAALSVFIHVFIHQFYYEPDSISYVSIADNLIHGHGYRTFEGAWCADWPPLTSLLLTIGQLLHLPQPYPFAVIDAVSIATIVGTAGGWLIRLTNHIRVTSATLTIAIISPPLLSIANAGYTECLFTTLGLGALAMADTYLVNKRCACLIAAAALTSLTLLTRYMGVAVLIAVVAAIILDRTASVRTRLISSVGFAIVGCLPIGVWCVINHAHTGTYTGSRSAPELSIVANLLHAALFVLLWFGAGVKVTWSALPFTDKTLGFCCSRPCLSQSLFCWRRWSMSTRPTIGCLRRRLSPPLSGSSQRHGIPCGTSASSHTYLCCGS